MVLIKSHILLLVSNQNQFHYSREILDLLVPQSSLASGKYYSSFWLYIFACPELIIQAESYYMWSFVSGFFHLTKFQATSMI